MDDSQVQQVIAAYEANDRAATVEALRGFFGRGDGATPATGGIGSGLLAGLFAKLIEKFLADPAAAIGMIRTILALFGIVIPALPGTTSVQSTWEADATLVQSLT